MPKVIFDESLIKQTTPWAACIALEEFLAAGGQCKVSDATNWVGIAYTCEMKSDSEPPSSPQLYHALAWAHLAILVRESLATGYSADDNWGIIAGAMWIRTKIIIRCGDHHGDHICDGRKVVEWCLSTPQVKRFLEMGNVSSLGSLEPEVKGVAEILTALIIAGRLVEEGTVGNFVASVRHARETASTKAP